MMLLWATLNNRPRKWAVQPENWTVSPRPRALLSEGQFSRRAACGIVQDALERLLHVMNALLTDDATVAIADGSPVLVGGASRDQDAKAGRAANGFGRGYKLHLVTTPRGVIHTLRITPLNANEGKQLIDMAPEIPDRVARILADGSYDSGTVHRELNQHKLRLIAPVKANRVGRRQDPYRLAALRYLQSPRGKHIFKTRSNIERLFGNLKSHPLGLQGLPSWVRTLNRVTRWIFGKIICWTTTRVLKQHQQPE
jgi:IS5 family transposase